MVLKCEKCGAMYIISDEKLKAQDWKFKCTKCQHETQVKPGEQQPVSQVTEPRKLQESLPPEIQKQLDQFKADPKSKSFMPVAEYYFKEGKLESALELLDNALKYNPGYISAHVLKGRTLFSLNRFEEAISELEKVCEQSKENTLARKILAKSYQAVGRYEEAENALEIVLMLDPADKEAKELIEGIKQLRGKSAEEPVPPSLSETSEEEKIESSAEIKEEEQIKEEPVSELPGEEAKEMSLSDIFEPPEGVEEKEAGEKEIEEIPAQEPSELFTETEIEKSLLPEEEKKEELKETLTEELTGKESAFPEEEFLAEEKTPEKAEDIFSDEQPTEVPEEKVELPEEFAHFPADKEVLSEEPEPPKIEETQEEITGFEPEPGVTPEIGEEEIKEEGTEEKEEGFETGRFDEGVTSEGVIEDVFKEEEEGPDISVETEVKETLPSEEMGPQIDEQVLEEIRPKTSVTEAKTVALSISTLKKEEKAKIKIKPVYVVIPLIILLLCGGAGYYYWTYEHIDPATASVDKLITVSKSIFKSSEKSKIEADRYFTEALVEYNKDHINGYLKSVELLTKAIAEDPHNPKYFAMLSEAYAELGSNTGLKQHFENSYRLATRSQQLSPQLPDSLRAVGHYYKAMGKTQEAMEYFRKALSFKSDDVYSMILLAELMGENSDRLGDALELLKKSTEIKELVIAYYLSGKISEKLGKNEEAIEYFKKVLGQQIHVKSIIAMAELLNRMGRFEEAESIFSSISGKTGELNPEENKKILKIRAVLNYENGNISGAKKFLEQLLKLSPQDTGAYELLGKIATQEYKLEEAGQYYEKALQIEPRNPEINYLCGNVYTLLRKYTQAINKYKTAVESRPDDFRFHNGLGNAYVLNGQLDEGIKELKTALEISPKSVDVLHNLVNAYLQKKQIDEAFSLAQRAVSADPYSIEARLSLSMVYYNTGKYQEAKTELEKVINLKPDSGEPYKLLAVILLEQKDIKNAEVFAEKAVKLSGDADSFSILARIKLLQSNFEEAISSIKKSIEQEPYNYKHYYDLGEIYFRSKRYNDALKTFQEATNYNPGDIPSNYMIGYTLEALGKNDEAYTQYEKIINKIDNKFAPAYFRMGILSELKGDHSRAISKFQSAVDLDNSKAEYLFYLGKTLYTAGDVMKAKEHLEKAVKIAPDDSEIHLYLGMAFDYLGDTNRALEEYSQSFRLKPTASEPLIRSANIYRSMGNYDKSMELLNRAIKLEPTKETIYYSLGLLYEERNELEKAIGYYKKALTLKSDYPDPYYSLGFIYFKLGKNTEARESFKKTLALGIDPNRAKKVKDTLSKIP